MARAESGFDAVGAYVAQLEPDLFGRRRMRRRIAEEVRGHLEDAAAAELAKGSSPRDAQRRAIERFGRPQAVINSWAESKGIGVVTNFTRYGGLAGIIGALGFTVAGMWAEISWSFSIGWFAEVALGFGAFLAVGMIALYMRLRGKLGRYARFGFRLIIAGLVVGFASSAMWFTAGAVAGLAMLIAGVAIYLLGAIRADVVPNGPLYLWVGAFVAAITIGFGGMITGLDTAFVVGVASYGMFNAGWVWLGLHLWRERPTVEERHTPAVA